MGSISMPVQTVGYIGLGKAGASMASNIPRAGFQMVVRDADPEREEKFAKENKNTTVAESGPQGFKDCDVIVTMLPQGKVVREVVLGENGIAKGLKPGMFLTKVLHRAHSSCLSSAIDDNQEPSLSTHHHHPRTTHNLLDTTSQTSASSSSTLPSPKPTYTTLTQATQH